MTGRDAAAGAVVPGDLLATVGLPPDASLDDVRALRDRLTDHLEAAERGRDTAPPAADVADVLLNDDVDDVPAEATPAPPVAKGSARPSRNLVPVLAVLLVLGVVLGVYFMGGPPSETPAPTAQATAQATAQQLDTARVATLEAAVAADPADLDAMRELGALHHAVGDFETAAQWQQRIVDLDPEDVDARLALGVALFGLGDLEGAEEHWGAAAELAPDLAEVHYNLGFLYLSMDPPAPDLAEEAWNRVIELDPDSSLAQTAAAHLTSMLGETTTGD